MARTIRTIEAVASSSGMEVDRKAGIIHGVKILGLVSDNNRKYMPEAVRKAKSLYEGIKVNIDHPAESGDVRSAEDRFGKLINVEYVEGEGLYGDLMFLKSHPMAERICEAAERNDMNDTFGLSHNAQGDGQEDDDGCFVVSSIVEVRHVDLVADPATTKSLREARAHMKVKESDEPRGRWNPTADAARNRKKNQPSPTEIHYRQKLGEVEKTVDSINNTHDPLYRLLDQLANDKLLGDKTRSNFRYFHNQIMKAQRILSDISGDARKILIQGTFTEAENTDDKDKKIKEADSSDTFVCKIYKDFGGPYGKTGPKTIKEQSVSGSKEKAIAWVKSQLKSTPIKDDEQGKDYTIFGVVLRKGSGAIVAKYEKSETGSSIITHAESKGASMKAKESKQKPYASLYKGMWTVQDSNGKDIYSIPNKQYAIKFLNDNWDKLSSGTMQPHSSVKTKESDMPDDEDKEMTEAEDMPVEDSSEEEMTEAADLGPLKRLMPIIDKAMNELEQFEKQMSGPGSQTKIGNTSSRNLQIAGEKLWDARSLINSIKNIEESKCEGMSDEEDEMMTEASGGILGPIMQEVTSNIGKSKEALKAAMIKGATIRHAIKGPLGAKITAELTKVLKDANGALDTLSMRVHSLEKDPAWANESVESDDEDEMMTEAEDMPVEDPSEEEMTESNGTNDIELGIRKQLENAVREVKSAWVALGGINKRSDVGPMTKRALINFANELDDVHTVLNRSKRKFDAFGSKDFSEAEGDPEDDMSIDDIIDKPAVEAYGEEDDMPMNEANDDKKKKEPGVEVYGTKGMKNTRFRLKFKTQKDYEKWYDKNQDDVNIEGLRDLEEQEDDMPMDEADDEYTDDEDKMAMESKQYRKLQQFCKKNNMVLTRDLYKDLRPLSESAQQRCILRIKLASKARKPRSSGSMMPMTESKVHTGDNVFNWLRS